MKGIIVAGGSGTRLYPLTKITSKQLLPVYDKPMIYYPLSILMILGIKDILIISTPQDLAPFIQLLGNGSAYGINLYYQTQEHPNGIAEVLRIGKSFIGTDDVTIILGDNLFYGPNIQKDFSQLMNLYYQKNLSSIIFGYWVSDAKPYGVIEQDGKNIKIIEKPKETNSHLMIPGLYIYDNQCVAFAESMKPSDRGELEITDVHNFYLNKNELYVHYLPRGYAWFDMGTLDKLLSASIFVHTIQNQQNTKIGCLEEIALQNKWITINDILGNKQKYSDDYIQYLHRVNNENL